MKAADIIAYVLDNHEWCDQSDKCDSCGRHHPCFDTPEATPCDGCLMKQEAVAWLTEHGA